MTDDDVDKITDGPHPVYGAVQSWVNQITLIIILLRSAQRIFRRN